MNHNFKLLLTKLIINAFYLLLVIKIIVFLFDFNYQILDVILEILILAFGVTYVMIIIFYNKK